MPTRLDLLSTLLVTGADARTFLQGQLTADLQLLTKQNVLLAACNSSQGRVQAVLWIIERDDGIALVTQRALLEQTATRLRRYVLRARATITTQTLDVGIARAEVESTTERSHHQRDAQSILCLPGLERQLVIAPVSEVTESDESESLAFHRDHLRAGLPQIYAQTHEQFIAQMLNIDALEGISFTKGCYTGQEIIARTHYRGAIKRRMFRYRALCAPMLPGTRILEGEHHAGDVVDSVATEDGCELLAVMNLTQKDAQLRPENAKEAVLIRLPLPYALSKEGDEVTG